MIPVAEGQRETTQPERLTGDNLGDLVPDEEERIAVVDHRSGGRAWTYRNIRKAGAAVESDLLRQGYERGDCIAIIAENSVAFLVAYLGIMRAGLVVVPVNFKLSRETIAFVLEDCGAKLAIVDPIGAQLLPAGFPHLDLDDWVADALDPAFGFGDAPPIKMRPEEIAAILYTSGSTGRPKGVPLSHQGQLWALSVQLRTQVPLGERTLIVAPMYHMNALFNISVALINGVEVVLMARFDAREWLRTIAAYRCTMLSGIPSMFAMAARERDLVETLDLSSVNRITIGSAPLTEALIDRVRAIFPNASVSNGYGSTEAGPSIFGDHPLGLPRPALSLGYPRSEIGWRLTGGSEAQGILELRTPALLKGYHNLPEATAERVRDGWYETGDIMRRDEDGFFYFVGRADDMFVCGGENIYPGEVEKLLERHPDIMQAAVVPVPDEIKGQIPIAFVVLAPGRALTAAKIKAYALAEGPAFSHPRAVVIVDQLPVAGTHKIDKRPLLPLALEAAKDLQR